jgi:hypothetical protein
MSHWASTSELNAVAKADPSYVGMTESGGRYDSAGLKAGADGGEDRSRQDCRRYQWVADIRTLEFSSAQE